jgi:hypothetical protein
MRKCGPAEQPKEEQLRLILREIEKKSQARKRAMMGKVRQARGSNGRGR